jgi:hypothetical protein
VPFATAEIEPTGIAASEAIFWLAAYRISVLEKAVQKAEQAKLEPALKDLKESLAKLLTGLDLLNDSMWFSFAALAAIRSLANQGVENVGQARGTGQYSRAVEWAFNELALPHMLKFRSVAEAEADAATLAKTKRAAASVIPDDLDKVIEWLSDRLLKALPLIERLIATHPDRLAVVRRFKLPGESQIQRAIDNIAQLRDALKHEQAARARLEALQR